eukprot:MONOS_8865.1-p1 / transcript=MONOS_8865.1 / gene=MONOS_8865 / organism=Monocercomonoides_exilis_PA203 / gene_product=unspecified product / transcript_product=unspecified product / location=Mono_scaffold00347:16257-17430(+) / protein_length=372 / sequence_SO=supercontig / SO=protein_coding / is_pseudo=false
MIKERNISMENAILLLKHVGYNKELKMIDLESFNYSLLSERMKEMINDENEKKKEEMNEKFLVDLSECYALQHSYFIPDEYRSIIVPPLLKAASKKEGNEETQKEVKMALLALSHVNTYFEIEQELYLNEITEIIEYHQEHQNLTRLAYQSAWQFLIKRFYWDKSLKEVIVKELHFAREAARELKELVKSVDWNRNEEENGRIEVLVIRRWFDVIYEFLYSNTLWNEEIAGLINCIVQVLRASRDNHKDIRNRCFDILRCAAENRNVKIDDLLKSGAIDLYLEEMKQSIISHSLIRNCYYFFLNVSKRLKEEEDDETEGKKRKEMKRKIFERMEEEGYEDAIAGFHDAVSFLNEKYYFQLSLDVSDYFVNV